MLLLIDAHSGFPVHYNNSDEREKSGQTIHSCSMRVQYAGIWAFIPSSPGADGAWEQVRPEQHTLISVFKLNSCKCLPVLTFKSQRTQARAQWFVRALIRSVLTRASERTQILSSVWSIVFEWKNSHRNCQTARLDKYPIANIASRTYSISAFS